MLPFVLSTPHSGYEVPVFLKDRIKVDLYNLLYHCDLWTWDFLSDLNFAWRIQSKYHYFFCNLNRSIQNINRLFPEKIPLHELEIYKKWTKITDQEKSYLIDNYYNLYYNQVLNIIQKKDAKLLIDLHSFGRSNEYSKKYGILDRTDIVLWNLWDENLDVDHKIGKISLEKEYMEELWKLFQREWFTVSFNRPFRGWSITKIFWNIIKTKSTIPTVQIEVHKRLFLDETYTKINNEKYLETNSKLKKIIFEFALNFKK